MTKLEELQAVLEAAEDYAKDILVAAKAALDAVDTALDAYKAELDKEKTNG